jgi:hypothetical protein
MGTRLELQTLLEGLDPGVNVYYQPPPEFQMTYPAIVYNLDFRVAHFADNIPYARTWRYQVTIIDRDPDSSIPEKVGGLPMTTFNRHYTTEGLNHNIFELYF